LGNLKFWHSSRNQQLGRLQELLNVTFKLQPFLQFLDEARADTSHPDSHCHTALHLAADEGHLLAVQCLVEGKVRAAEAGETFAVIW
jgi:ankyrin repeat protein